MIKEIFGEKLGMTQTFNEEGDLVGVTILHIEPVCVLEKISYPGKEAVKIGILKIPENRIEKIKKPLLGYFKKLGVSPYKFIKEVAVEEAVQDVGGQKKADAAEQTAEGKTEEKGENQQKSGKEKVGIEIFKEGEFVDVRAKSKGRGFAGGMKRHGWAGQPKSHGSTTHRRIGSVGAHTYPARIIKGLRMPGHMGNAYRTVRNLKVIKVDKEKNLLFLRGGVPGAIKSIVQIKKIG